MKLGQKQNRIQKKAAIVPRVETVVMTPKRWNDQGFRKHAPAAPKGTPQKTSWWAKAAQPGRRDEFMAAAKERNADDAGWTNAAPHSNQGFD